MADDHVAGASVIQVGTIRLYAIPVHHGDDYICHGLAMGDPGKRILYLSDVAWIPEESVRAIDILGPYQVMIIDSLLFNRPHYSHVCVEEIFPFVHRWRPKETYIVGFGCTLSVGELDAALELRVQSLRSGELISGPLETSTSGDYRYRLEQQKRLLEEIEMPEWRPPSTSIECIKLATDGLTMVF
eukprot:Protomagalhaensia_sp_Gyna_25__1002@NODE_1486_length_1797_cov_44_657565_g1203_i0_p1_GENE_NODE_1486_length_1797_cov_44_657565_g1203_i0NODE_1486_length_1797_cov_44_657565_g1203_i0_p1_ORF_typecomplete_len212_score36_82Lactamase_B_2/PF12706_7/3_3e08_NODE_1486_length_1797_cov_44_657565_g1203_i011621719